MSLHNPKKLIFIHHSVGGHWLTHENGGLVAALNKNGFYVNDITYGWQPRWMEDSPIKKLRNNFWSLIKHNPGGAYRIGDRTDIGHFYEWFAGPNADSIMAAVYRENNETVRYGNHSNRIPNPGDNVENQIVMIKPCFPNSLLSGNGNDEPAAGQNPPRNYSAGSNLHKVANAKRIYNDILHYFKKHNDKFFVMVTAPPQTVLPDNGSTARAFNNWLVHGWLQQNSYDLKNVMVFDLFNVLTTGVDWNTNDLGSENGNHHRIWKNQEQHQIQTEHNLLAYPRNGNNNHPSKAGLEKATSEFVELFSTRYRFWEISVKPR